jgi:hypothetical protein
MAEGQINSVILDKANRFKLYLESGIYNERGPSFDILFKIILYSISQFITEESELSDGLDENSKHLLSKENWEKFYKIYSGDSTLFEVGCFFYFLIDKWLREKKPNINVYGFFNPLLNDFVKQFNKIFRHINSRDFYKQRYSKYLQIEKEQGTIEDYFFYVQQLVYLTRDNIPPQEQDFEITYNVPFKHSLWIRINFFAWYESIVPNTIQTFNSYVKQVEENSH